MGSIPAETTIAESLRSVGYATGAFGKWHLGHAREFLPLQHGFDEYFGLPYSNDMWPVDYDGVPVTEGNKSQYPPLPLIDGNDVIEIVDELSDQGHGRASAWAHVHVIQGMDSVRHRPA